MWRGKSKAQTVVFTSVGALEVEGIWLLHDSLVKLYINGCVKGGKVLSQIGWIVNNNGALFFNVVTRNKNLAMQTCSAHKNI